MQHEIDVYYLLNVARYVMPYTTAITTSVKFRQKAVIFEKSPVNIWCFGFFFRKILIFVRV
jgi:hypothetical protein